MQITTMAIPPIPNGIRDTEIINYVPPSTYDTEQPFTIIDQLHDHCGHSDLESNI